MAKASRARPRAGERGAVRGEDLPPHRALNPHIALLPALARLPGKRRDYRFIRNVRLGENMYSPPFIVTKPENATLFSIPPAASPQTLGSS